MLEGLKERAAEARLRFGVWTRERKERAAERKAMQAAQPDAHGRFFLLHVPAAATVFAAFVEIYWAVLFCIEATGHLNGNFDMEAAWNAPLRFVWDFAFSGNLFVLLGLLAATAPIVMISMVWLPVQFAMRGFGRWRRGTLIAVGLLANAIVIISGTVVMNHNRQEQVREALVVEQSADAQRSMLAASVDDLRAELETLMNHRSTYVATAASVGAAAYERDYVAQARATNDPRLPLLERALGSARRADDLRDQIRQARAQVAQAAPAAATAATVQDDVGAGLNAFAQQVKVWRPPLIAVACTLIGILGAWWTLAMLLHMNPRDVLRSGWADESHRIEDMRDEAAPAPQPMTPPREEVFDAETGEALVKVKPREYWRRKGARKGKPTKVDVESDIPPDESGVEYDGGGRMASVSEPLSPTITPAADVTETEAEHAVQAAAENEQEEQFPVQPEPSELTDDALAAYEEAGLIETAVDEPNADERRNDEQQEQQQQDEPAVHVALPEGEGVMVAEGGQEREPETREDRLIAGVAAQ